MSRVRVSLDGLWDFIPDPRQEFSHESLQKAGTPRSVRVPGPWQAQFEDLRHYSGVAWYRRSFELGHMALEPVAPSPIHVVHFGAVDYHATVWLNGRLIGEHEGGYLPFEMPLEDALNWAGNNELVVRVIDPGDHRELFPQFAFSEIPHGKQSWYGPISGIWQSVYVEVRHDTHVRRLHVTPDVANGQAHVDLSLNRPAERPLGLRLTVTDPLGKQYAHSFVIEKGADRHQAAVHIPDPLLWDTHSPHLYRLEAALVEEGTAGRKVDSLAADFGMRSISTSADGHLMLNDRILYLRGALDQDYYPDMIYTPFSDAELNEQFVKARRLGLNCLRTHIKITDPRYYDAADRAGVLIWTELPNWENLTARVKERARETLTGMVERDWNHPSIIIWTIINEGWGVDLAVNAEHRAWLAETYDYLKQLDPHRLVVGNSACITNFHVVTDIEDFHNYYSIPDHYQKWRAWVETFAARPPWTFAHAYRDIDSWREFLRDPWKAVPRTPAPEVRRSGREPIVVSEFGNWGLPDVDKLRSCYGGEDPWWFETGTEWGEGAVYPHGATERFKRWHLDKVFPTFSDLASASQRMQYCALKYQIEQIRRHPSIVGYIITEFTDVHWESNGLLDICRNPKSFYDVIADINSADAIVPGWKRVAYWEGEQCQVDLSLSHFSNHDLAGSRLEWHLDLEPDIRGSFGGLAPRAAQITAIGAIRFKVPAAGRGVRARLIFHLLDAGGSAVTRNHLELYFFDRAAGRAAETVLSAPPRLGKKLQALGYKLTDRLDDADLAIVDKMTDEFRWYVQNGGRVLWLANTKNSQQTYLGSVEIAERQGRRWQGDWASNMNWIRQDQMFKNIPTGGLVDFAFADLTPEHVITGLSPRDFASDVHAGLFVGWLHHIVALVAERCYGNGRLLISTFRLLNQKPAHPVAAIMLRDMILHLLR
ncbi:MAG: glycoside hydrolase family 2 TIM barrel-domain containing protein [Blastocatellia bacterium]